jgi:hypothetical protein
MKIEKQNKKVFKVSFDDYYNKVDYIIAINLRQAKALAERVFASKKITKVENIDLNRSI